MTLYISKAANLFADLLETGSIPASAIDKGSKETKRQFATLISTEIIKKQRSASGNCYQLFQLEKLRIHLEKTFPNGLLKPIGKDTSNRSYGVFTNGDSKSITKLDFDLIMLRGSAEVSIDDEHYELNNSDAAFLSLKISATQTIDITNPNLTVVTIENPTVFAELNKISGLEWDIAIYTAGKISNFLLTQLKQWHTAGHQLIHFGDYDFVGLLEYARILYLCPQVELHWPQHLNADFINRYGKSQLHEDQISQHQTLLNKLELLPTSPQKQTLVKMHQLLQKTAKGLEQEAFLF